MGCMGVQRARSTYDWSEIMKSIQALDCLKDQKTICQNG